MTKPIIVPIHPTSLRFTLLAFVAGTALASGREPTPPKAAEHEPPLPADIAGPPEKLSPKDAAVDQLMAERESPQAFEKAVANARKKGVSEQIILEARFLFDVDRHDDAAVSALLPEFTKRRDSFQPKDSAIFAVKEDWLAVIEYIQSIDALRKNDKAAFKQHITEAFWLSPRQGSAFAPRIERLRLAEAMRDLHLDFQTELAGLLAPAPAKLASLLADDRKGLLLHFWSPWARECADTMDDFAATARLLDQHHFAVASILAEDAPDLLVDARKLVHALPKDLPCHWLLDRKESPLASLLRVQSLPVMILVQPDGRILFNGDPVDDELWIQLRTLDPKLERPRVAPIPNKP